MQQHDSQQEGKGQERQGIKLVRHNCHAEYHQISCTGNVGCQQTSLRVGGISLDT